CTGPLLPQPAAATSAKAPAAASERSIARAIRFEGETGRVRFTAGPRTSLVERRGRHAALSPIIARFPLPSHMKSGGFGDRRTGPGDLAWPPGRGGATSSGGASFRVVPSGGRRAALR